MFYYTGYITHKDWTNDVLNNRCGYDYFYTELNGQIIGKSEKEPYLIVKYANNFTCNLWGFMNYELVDSDIKIYVKNDDYKKCYSCKSNNRDRYIVYANYNTINIFIAVISFFAFLITMTMTISNDL